MAILGDAAYRKVKSTGPDKKLWTGTKYEYWETTTSVVNVGDRFIVILGFDAAEGAGSVLTIKNPNGKVVASAGRINTTWARTGITVPAQTWTYTDDGAATTVDLVNAGTPTTITVPSIALTEGAITGTIFTLPTKMLFPPTYTLTLNAAVQGAHGFYCIDVDAAAELMK